MWIPNQINRFFVHNLSITLQNIDYNQYNYNVKNRFIITALPQIWGPKFKGFQG